ncbi:MAG: hypothetical protein KatS3mg111_1092 [Pirellulaceae bacterium]|nr:MAG: hypothetical protein KatS3mg111_1092 [Pirellulaceae bacterium]
MQAGQGKGRLTDRRMLPPVHRYSSHLLGDALIPASSLPYPRLRCRSLRGTVLRRRGPSSAVSTVGSSVALVAICLGLALLLTGGCAQLRLPQIDPTGQRIFLPPPNSTQLTLPRLHATETEPGLIPNPAFAAPPTPPPCVDASGAPLCNLFDPQTRHWKELQRKFRQPGAAGELLLTPLRVVAPVGGEVVLLAGICGPDGYLVKRQPIEWMLSPDSVGTFIEVGDEDRSLLMRTVRFRDPKVEKLDVDFAKGRTSSKSGLITRGTTNPRDDIPLLEGQTWLSLSSPSEGISRVTVLAPDSELWDRRRQTATIYWVDAQWEFPAPVIRRAGEPVTLITRVTKAENLVPAEGWIVEYTIQDPSIATFDPATGSTKATVVVNQDGQAPVTVHAQPGAFGTTLIAIDVIRPEQPEDNLPRLVLGRGTTSVTFSSAGLALHAEGPAMGSVGEPMTYRAVMANPGDIDAENARLTLRIPAGTRVVDRSLQPTTETDDYLVWDQGVLPAGRQLETIVTLEALQAGVFDVIFQAEAAGGLSQQRAVRTEVVQPSLSVRFQPAGGVAQAEVGETVQYEIDIQNSGRQALTGIRLVIESDPGLPELNTGQNRVEQDIPVLQPGETRHIGIAFQVQQATQLGARLQVYAGGQLLAEKSTSVLGHPPRPKQADVDVAIEFPSEVTVGSPGVRAIVTVSNPGEVTLNDLQVDLEFDRSLRPVAVDNSNAGRFQVAPGGRAATWQVPTLFARPADGAPYMRQLILEFEVVSATDRGVLAATVRSDQGATDQATATFRAVAPTPPPATTPAQPVLPPESERAGQLQLTIDDYGDPTVVGRPLRYDLTVTNAQNLPDRNVAVLMRLPPGVDLNQITRDGNPVNYQFAENNTIVLPNIQFMRPGESITFFIVVTPQIPQRMELRAQAYSDARPDPVEAAETTQVNLQ